MRRLLFISLVIALLFLSACGGGGSNNITPPPPPPPPTPDFSITDFAGTYVFSFAGSEGAGETYFTARFVADGAGNLAGTLSFNHAELSNGIQVFPQTTGTYTVAEDGRMIISLTTPAPSFNNLTGPFVFQATLRKNATTMELIPMQPGFSGSGMITKVSETPPSSLSGNFAFRYEGSTNVLGMQFGIGRMHFGSDGTVAGALDSNLRGVPNLSLPFTGTYTINLDGTGTIALSYGQITGYLAPPTDLRFHAVSNAELVFLGADPGTAVLGEAKRQSGGPFSNASLNGPFVFQGNGFAFDPNTTYYAGTTAMIGQLTFDGNGNASGAMDLANPTNIATNIALTGAVSVDSNGRVFAGILNEGATTNMVLYLVSSTEAYFLTMDPSSLASGRMKAQSISNLSAASFTGKYTLFMAAPLWDQTSISGRMKADGNGSLTGTVDGMSQGQSATGVSMTGTYSFDAIGHAVITITGSGGSSSFTGYALSEKDLFILTADPQPMVSGCAHKQM
jgi:hypothetical protein